MIELTKICGIYKLTSPTNKVYVGQSKNISARWDRYRKGRCEGQRKLYHSLIKYGWFHHTFEIIEECEVDDLNCRERYWQDFYDVKDRDKGLNALLTECGELKEEILKLKRISKIGNIEKVKIVRGKLGHHKCKIVLDTQTGVFYSSLKELCNLYTNLKYDTMKERLRGSLKNNTPFIYT